MTIKTEHFPKTDYLLVVMEGPWTEAGIKASIDKMKAESITHGLKKILLDLKGLPLPETEMVRFYSGEYLAKVMPRPYKIAAFSHPEKINRFGETVAVNRGAWLQVFHDHDSALEWLLND